MSGRLFHKYGNLLKKVPLNNSVLTLLIFNLLLEYDLNLLSEQNSNIFQLNSYSNTLQFIKCCYVFNFSLVHQWEKNELVKAFIVS